MCIHTCPSETSGASGPQRTYVWREALYIWERGRKERAENGKTELLKRLFHQRVGDRQISISAEFIGWYFYRFLSSFPLFCNILMDSAKSMHKLHHASDSALIQSFTKRWALGCGDELYAHVKLSNMLEQFKRTNIVSLSTASKFGWQILPN